LPKGLILGRKGVSRSPVGFAARVPPECGDLITYSGDGHLITFAPTGTGKTSGPVITNSLTHPGQLIVLDIKGEIYAKTAAARRAMKQKVHILDLRDEAKTDSLNPLDLATRCGTDPTTIARSFAAEMIERSSDDRDRFWADWGESMITAGVAWLLEDCEPIQRRISSVFDLFNNDDVSYKIACLMDQKKIRNRAAFATLASFLQLPDNSTRPGVLATAQVNLRLFESDLARKLTDTSSMDVDALIAGKPMSLYIVVPPFRLTAYRPLLRLWLSGLILAMTQRKQPP
jgi:type IV secretion system protein VirD4